MTKAGLAAIPAALADAIQRNSELPAIDRTA
jgi:hypothetical protein